MERLTKIRMIVDIDLSANGVPERWLKENCELAIQHAMGEGAFTGNSDAQIENWRVIFEKRNRILR